MVKIAQDQLSPLNSPNFIRGPRYRQLAAQIGNALDSFGPILLALGQQLDRYEGIGGSKMTAKSRMGFLNGEREMTNLSILLDRQVNALNLLLQAMHQTWMQQSEILTHEESQSILRLAQDCSSSLVGLQDVASYISENTAAISTQFEFDDVLRGTWLYQAAERSHLRQVIRARKVNEVDTTSTDSIIQPRETAGPEQSVRAMILSKPIALSDSPQSQRGISVNVHGETTVETPGIDDRRIQEGSSHSNSGSSDGPDSNAEAERSTQPLLSAGDLNPPQAQTGFGYWRKAFQRRKSNTYDTKPHQNKRKEDIQRSITTKVLLLGASGGGKTTIFNALRLFTDAECVKREDVYIRTLVWHNALDSVRGILRAIEGPDLTDAKALLLDFCPDCGYDPALNPGHAFDVAQTISSLRLNSEFRKALKWRPDNRFQDNSEYYIENIHRLAEQALHRSTPTAGDLLRTQVTTTGIHEMKFTYNGCQFAIYDCGGERSERQKWKHAFPDVSVVFWPIETTGYGRSLREGIIPDRMREQCLLFESATRSPFFIRSRFVVVFTKIDLLDEYLKDDGFRQHLRSNGVPTEADEYLDHLEWLFRSLTPWAATEEERIQFVRANLVDADEHNVAIDILNILDSFGSAGQLARSGEEARIFDE
ncbi:G-protein alpha subunit-domain-containing protein [Xylaria sp. FL0043]|nr:G-protein alpha subunit-domain-containing protein [Xylaria sp. FL0043]